MPGIFQMPHEADVGPVCQRIVASLRNLAADVERLIACIAPLPPNPAVPLKAVPAPAAKPVPSSLSPKYSAARIDVLREHYPAGTPAAEILPLINALPGPPFELKHVARAANVAGLKRPPGFKAAATKRYHDAQRDAGPGQPVSMARRRSAERDALLREHYPAGMLNVDLLPLLNALPGRKLCGDDLSIMAYDLGLKRPPGFNGRAAPAADNAELRTKAREAILRATWRADKPRAGILALLNMQAGPRLTLARMCAWGAELGLDEQPPAAPPAAAPAPAKTGAPAARKTPVPAKGAPPKLAAYQPPQSAAAPPPRIPTPAERKRAAEAAAIAAHIAQKGVTLCPPAIAVVTTHTPTPAEAAAIREIVDAAETARRAEMEENQARMRRNRALKLAGKRPLERAHA
jgi:hypothetical protein